MSLTFSRFRSGKVVRRYVAAVAAGLLIGCGGGDLSPTEQVEALIGALASAAEQRDAAALAGALDRDYRDPAGRDRQTLRRIIQLELQRRRSIHLLTHVRSIEQTTAQRVTAQVVVAAAAVPIDSAGALAGINAEVMVFELVFESVDAGEWTITSAQWRRGTPLDFL